MDKKNGSGQGSDLAARSDLKKDDSKKERGCCSWFGQRHAIAIFAFFAVTIGYAQRVNLSIAIVAMTDRNTTLESDSEYFAWDEGIRSAILSSFFWGYVITQIPAGQLAERFGPKIVLAVGVGMCSLFTLVSPVAVNGGWEWLCASRVFQGLGQAVLYPSIHALLARWSPPSERGRMSAFSYAGAQFGTIVALATGGLLAATKGFGWPTIFYIFGGLGLLWTVAWLFFGSSEPNEHCWISESELHYITSALNSQKDHMAQKELATPWKSILTCVPVLALIMAHSGQNFGYWTLLTKIPTYMSSILNYNIKQNGILSALPYMVMTIFSLSISWVSDKALQRGWLTVRIARKLANSIGHWGPAITLMMLGYLPSNQPVATLWLLTLAVGLNGAAYVGYQVNHIDLSPNFAGTLMGITNCVANFMSIIAPLVAGTIAPDSTNSDQWRMVFFVSAAVYFVFNLVFVIFGSGEVQPWNNPNTAEKEASDKVEPCSSETNRETDIVIRL